MQRESNYRSDINALRALALALVILFHFSVSGFSGGFVGVDVFFVISGYLMTRIVFERSDRGVFAVLEFYLDRARRIIPALAFMIVAVGIFGAAILIPNKLLIFGKHAAAALIFASNFLFWREAGYFAPDGTSKWLLHTWSLSVEWQFYLIYPLIIVLSYRIGGRRLACWSVLALTVVSLVLSTWLSMVAPTAGFYLLPGRVWEMTAGGLVYLFPLKILGERRFGAATQMIGLTLILLAACFIAANSAWPGALAIVPVGGTMLIISAQQSNFVTTNPVVAWLGRSSYSSYLWHWPIVCCLAYLNLDQSVSWTVAGITLSLVLGGLSYHMLETRAFFRRRAPTNLARVMQLAAFASVCLVIAVASAGIWRSRGLPNRFSPEVIAADAASRDVVTFDGNCFDPSKNDDPPCIFGDDRGSIVLEVIGDSHAQAMLPAMINALPDGHALEYHASPACPTIATARPTDPESRCWEFNRRFLDPLINSPETKVPLLIVNNWTMRHDADAFQFFTELSGTNSAKVDSSYEEELRATVCQLRRTRPVYLTAPLPTFRERVAENLAAALVFRRDAPDIVKPLPEHRLEHAHEIGTLQRVAGECGAVLLDPTPLLCPNGVCRGSDQHVPIYKDQHHLTARGAARLTPMFKTIFSAR